MNTRGILLWFPFFLICLAGVAQISPDCSTAIPICNNTPVNGSVGGYGVDDFSGSASTGCLETSTSGVIESNSAWYRFRTGASGQLGFNIGFDASEDWDFALYRASDCNSLGNPIRCNFFDNRDNESFMGVGEDPSGATASVLYENWLDVQPGEDYYLLINNFSNTNSGFSIQFSGNIFITDPNTALDCSIISNLLGPPIAVCEGENVVLDATTADAIVYDWFLDDGNGFLPIGGAHDPTLLAVTDGLYRVSITTSSADIIISDVQVAFSPVPITFTVQGDAVCSGVASYDLSLKDAEALGTQSPTEVRVSYHASQADAISGNNSMLKDFPWGNTTETLYVRTTSITNPSCFDASQQFQLTALESPSLDFPQEAFLCDGSGAITIGDTSPDSNYTYTWDTGQSTSSISVSTPGQYTLTILNQQAGLSCTTVSEITVVVSDLPVITAILVEDLQQDNTITVETAQTGNYEYQLDGGPMQTSPVFTDVAPGAHQLTVNDLNGCGSVTENITVVGFPKFFTPNGDGSNDLWNILGLDTLEDPTVFIYNRYGQLIDQISSTDTGWDGTFNGNTMPATDYWFKLTYTDQSGQVVDAKYIQNHFSLRR